MISDLTPKQKELANYMSELSEQAYHAEWMLNLEYELWQLMNGEVLNYGRLEFTKEIKQKLKDLSEGIDGWIYFDETSEETYITITEWVQKLNRHENGLI